MTDGPRIDDLRVSFIWTETYLEHLGAAAPDLAAAPLAFLSRQYHYAPRFDELKAGKGVAAELGLTFPWKREADSQFWKSYLNLEALSRLTGQNAWHHLVPLRDKTLIVLEAPWLQPGRFFVECFFYPHGIGVVATAVILPNDNSGMPLKEAVETTLKLRHGEQYTFDNAGAQVAAALDGAIVQNLPKVRAHFLGSAFTPSPQPPPNLFAVSTVIRGDHVAIDVAPKEDDEIHRSLEGMTKWYPNWEVADLSPLAETRLDRVGKHSPARVIYAPRRARAVWFPDTFRPEGKTKKRGSILSCYHRNLVLASMQVESLGGLVMKTAAMLHAGVPITSTQEQCARLAVGILGRLYGGMNSYRSASVRRQMLKNDLVDTISELRQTLSVEGTPPLF